MSNFPYSELCPADITDAAGQTWFLTLQTHRHSGQRYDEGVLYVAVTNESGEWAACEMNLFELSPFEHEPWVYAPERGNAVDVARAIALDRFCERLVASGLSRDEASEVRAAVINADALPDETWPSWETMDDEDREFAGMLAA